MTKLSKNKKITIAVLMVTLVAAIAINVSLAYFTQKTDEITNKFTLGDIDIDIDEDWDPEDGEDMLPGTTVDKAPWIKATEGDSYVRMVMQVKDKDGVVITDATRLAKILYTLRFSTTINAGDKLSTTALATVKNFNDTAFTYNAALSGNGVYVYDYNFVLTEGNKTPVLITHVVIPTDWDEADIAILNGPYQVTFTGYGIQAENLTATEAFAALTDKFF